MPEMVLELSHVAKRFQGVVAVEDMSMTVEGGKVTSLIGPNGSGKTTVMNIVTGLYPADSGRVTFDGVDISRLPSHRIALLGIARTFQNIRLLADQTVLQNVLLGAWRHLGVSLADALLRSPRLRRNERREEKRCETLLEFMGIDRIRDRPVSSLSYGDRRRVEIARALATKPRLLLLDEPAAGMNAAEKQQLADAIVKIRGIGTGVLLIEHDIDFVSRVSDHIVVLNFGREIAAGPPAEIRRTPSVIEAYLGADHA